MSEAAHNMDEPGKAREAFRSVTRDIAWVAEAPKPHKLWLGALGISTLMLLIGLYSIYVLVTTGIGVWGNSNTVGWALFSETGTRGVRVGVWVLLFLAGFTLIAWRLNAAYWKDIK